MAQGLGQGGGLFEPPLVGGVGYDDWATMSGMQAGHPLVGGSAGQPGYGSGHRQVAVAGPDVTGTQSATPTRAHWSELFNFKGNPIGWVAILAILYLGMSAIHVRASGGVSGRIGK